MIKRKITKEIKSSYMVSNSFDQLEQNLQFNNYEKKYFQKNKIFGYSCLIVIFLLFFIVNVKTSQQLNTNKKLEIVINNLLENDEQQELFIKFQELINSSNSFVLIVDFKEFEDNKFYQEADEYMLKELEGCNITPTPNEIGFFEKLTTGYEIHIFQSDDYISTKLCRIVNSKYVKSTKLYI